MKELIQPLLILGLGGYLLADHFVNGPAEEEAALDRQAALTDKVRDLEKQLVSAVRGGYTPSPSAPKRVTTPEPEEEGVRTDPYEEELADAAQQHHQQQIDLALDLLEVDYKAKIEEVRATISRGNDALARARNTPVPYEVSTSRIKQSQANREKQMAEKRARIEQISAALEPYRQQERDLRAELARKQAELRAQR